VRLLAVVLALALAQPAAAASDFKSFQGVWQGTIGAHSVRVCYESGEFRNEGKYYYTRHLKTIPLIAVDKVSGQMTEGWANTKGVARWTITRVASDRVEGVWRGDGATLPIRLDRLQFDTGEDFDLPCSSLTFHQPLFDAARIITTPARERGLALEKWTLVFPGEDVTLESVQLEGAGAATAAINRRLRVPFDKADEGWKWCLRNARAFGGDYHHELAVAMVTSRWLSVVETSENFCGGAHPSNSRSAILFDRRTGAIANLVDWLAPTNIHREKVEGFEETLDSLKGPLLAAVITAHPGSADNDECAETIRSTTDWSLELKVDGIAFTPDLPRVVMACGDEVMLSWNALAPFLGAEGKREVAALRSELTRH
jgi:hypothetical protein